MKTLKIMIAVLFAFAIMTPAIAQENGDGLAKLKTKLISELNDEDGLKDNVKQFVKESLLPLISNEVFVEETIAQNKEGMSLEKIKEIDVIWQDAEDMIDIYEEKLNSPCSKEIKKILKKMPEVLEVFVMDDQGAVVGENDLTSDYWQGDEGKWSNSYNDAKGGVDVGKLKFDASANMNLQQVSLPVADKDGTIVGAVTFGIVVDRL